MWPAFLLSPKAGERLFEQPASEPGGDPTGGGEAPGARAPLASRMRPRDLDGFVGQAGLLAPGSALRTAIESGEPHSAIFYGPPGTGKTTLARIIAERAHGEQSRTATGTQCGKRATSVRKPPTSNSGLTPCLNRR